MSPQPLPVHLVCFLSSYNNGLIFQTLAKVHFDALSFNILGITQVFFLSSKGGTFTTTSGLYAGNNSLTNSTGFNSTQQVAAARHVTSFSPFVAMEKLQVPRLINVSPFHLWHVRTINHSGCQKLRRSTTSSMHVSCHSGEGGSRQDTRQNIVQM